jgi:hypothetical protein
MKFGIWKLFENLSSKFKCRYNLVIITGSLRDGQYAFFIISCSILIRIRNVSSKSCRENQNTRFMFIFFENGTVYEIKWKKMYIRTGHKWQYGACALHAGYLKQHTHTHRICNTYCFSTATIVTRTRLDVTWYAHCLYCYVLFSLQRA